MSCNPCSSLCFSGSNEVLPLTAGANRVSPSSQSLKERVCPYCKLLPAVFLLAVNVLGIALVLIYHNHYLLIPFGVGVAFSVHQIHFAYNARLLQSLEITDRHLRLTNIGLQARLAEATAHSERLGGQVDHLTGQVAANAAVVRDITAQRDRFQAENENLRKGVSDLNAALTRMHAERRGELERFNAIADAAEKAQRGQGDEMRKIFAAYQAQVEAHEKQNAAHQLLVSDQRTTIADQLSSLQALALAQRAQFQTLELIVGNDAFKKQMDQFQDSTVRWMGIEKSIAARTGELRAIEDRLARTSAALDEQTKQLAAQNAVYAERNAEHNGLLAQQRQVIQVSAMSLLAMAGGSPGASPLRPAPPPIDVPTAVGTAIVASALGSAAMATAEASTPGNGTARVLTFGTPDANAKK